MASWCTWGRTCAPSTPAPWPRSCTGTICPRSCALLAWCWVRGPPTHFDSSILANLHMSTPSHSSPGRAHCWHGTACALLAWHMPVVRTAGMAHAGRAHRWHGTCRAALASTCVRGTRRAHQLVSTALCRPLPYTTPQSLTVYIIALWLR